MNRQAPAERTLDCAVRGTAPGGARVVTRWAGVEHARDVSLRDWAELLASRPETKPREEVERAPVLAFGRHMFDLVLRDDPNWLTAVKGSGPLCLRFLADSTCVNLPWEWLARGDAFLALEDSMHVCRRARVDADRPAGAWPAPPLRVLFASAVAGGDDIGVRRELDLVLAAADSARREGRPTFEVDPAPAIGLEPLDRRLREATRDGRPYQLIHLALHASWGGVHGLETVAGEIELAPAQQLAERLAAAAPCAVVATTCWGADALGLAAATARQGVPEVVGFSGEAEDGHVLAFVRGFYGAFGGTAFADAVRAGRLALQARADSQGRALADWTRLVHFQGHALAAPAEGKPKCDSSPKAQRSDPGSTTYHQSSNFAHAKIRDVNISYMQGERGKRH